MDNIGWSQTPGERAVSIALVCMRLKTVVTQTRDLLQSKKSEADVNYIAWLTRNLVELRIWAEYCSVSAENALEFHEDSVRDLIELNKKVPGIDDETKAELKKAKAMLLNPKPDHRFKSVRDAATEVNMFMFYEQNNKTLSKFAHPTALSVMSNLTKEARLTICIGFVEAGLAITEETLAKLEGGHLAETYKKYLPALKRTLLEHPELQSNFEGIDLG
jgi:hypothetical protein